MSPSPKTLGTAGKALWRSIVKALPESMELDERELAILTLAARQADDVAKLEALVKKAGPMAKGSAGQPVLHPAVTEARMGRLAIDRLLGRLSLPAEDDAPRTEASRRAQRAARARWDQQTARRERLTRGAA